jgi:diadenylate cyclase
MQILFGIMALFVLVNLVSAFNMRVFRGLFGIIGEVFVLAIIVLFAPEIRRLLSVITQNPFFRGFINAPDQGPIVDELVAAALEMGRNRVGALIAIARTTGLRTYVETGTRLHSNVSRDLLNTLFFPKSPLHDGAVIIQDGKLEAARCILPVSEDRRIDPNLGLRHRAALGLTEQTDAIVIVVSEERGSISIAERGTLHLNLSESTLRQRLVSALSPTSVEKPILTTTVDA